GDVSAIDEDADDGDLRFRVRPDSKAETVNLSVVGKGCPAATVPLTLSDGDGVIEASVALVTGAQARIHVLPPADNVHEVGLQRYADANADWISAGAGSFQPNFEEVGKKPNDLAFDSLVPGKYRARDGLTGVV